MDRIERELRELIERHEDAAAEAYGAGSMGFSVPIPELRNILEPGSAPVFPATPGYAATCEICAPRGDGRSRRRGGYRGLSAPA